MKMVKKYRICNESNPEYKSQTGPFKHKTHELNTEIVFWR